MHPLLSKLESPLELHGMSPAQLEELAREIRDVLCRLVTTRPAHFASNLGVVELCIALHATFDFRRDLSAKRPRFDEGGLRDWLRSARRQA